MPNSDSSKEKHRENQDHFNRTLGMSTLSVQAAEPQTAPAYIGQAFNQIYGKAYRSENVQGKVSLVIFAHELSKTHATMEETTPNPLLSRVKKHRLR